MKSAGLALLCASSALARNIDRWNAQRPILNDKPSVSNDRPSSIVADNVERFLVETAPGETSWITEDEKWQLRREGVNFMDITEYSELHNSFATREVIQVNFPPNVTQKDSLKPLLKDLSKDNMKANLVKFSSFYTRYYKSKTGAESSAWLQGKVTDIIKESGAAKAGATVESFPHSWGQNSIIARIPGKSNRTVVVGAHQDSINLFLPSLLAAPGADDDGSGTVTILESLRVLLQDKTVVAGKADNTIEFHWYSAEEGGLLGSQAIFQEYARERRDVRAMLQQDMTGFTKRTLDAGKPEALGVITDFVDPSLTEFIKTVIKAYCDIPFVLTKCGYACSDHASASKAGYPSAFAIESEFDLSNNKIHTEGDTVANLDFGHMLQHAKFTLSLVYELAFAKLDRA